MGDKVSVIIYGAGFRGGRNFLALAEENIHVEAFCDRDAKQFPLYFGCDVFSMEEAIKRYAGLPFIVSLDQKSAREEVVEALRKSGIETYESFEAFYTGNVDADINTVRCGVRAPFQVVSKLLEKRTGLVAFSFGIGYDFSFELELAEKYQMQVYAFDPSPEVIQKMKEFELPDNFEYFAYGLSDEDSEKVFYKPSSGQDYSEYFASWTSSEKTTMQVYRLKTLMEKMGHDHLDLLKMDIEGSEFLALPDILESGVQFDQLCIETHARIFPDSVNKMRQFKKALNEHGYLMVSSGREEQTYLHRDFVQQIKDNNE